MFIPTSIGHLFGQEHLLEILSIWLQDPTKIPQQILLHGAYGCGKTTVARLLGKVLTSISSEFEEINAAESRGIDDVRNWIESSRFSAFGRARVFCIDELHQMTKAAQSAFLKALENPPSNVYYILCTTDPLGLLPTIRSRCTQLEIRRLSKESGIDLLTFISKGKLSDSLMDAIYAQSGGHARNMVKMADIALASNAQHIDQINQIGFRPDQFNMLLSEALSGSCSKTKFLEAIVRHNAELDKMAYVLDNFIDSSVLTSDLVRKNYENFLQVRILRKEYKISVMEALIHFVSRLGD